VSPGDAAGVRSVVPMLIVSSMTRSLAYYVDGLGFTIEHKWVVDGRGDLAGSASAWRGLVGASGRQRHVGHHAHRSGRLPPQLREPTDAPEETKVSELSAR
jgi:catechol 2,3-dioxygenase-like lactoylglutathione lyase family enzyme